MKNRKSNRLIIKSVAMIGSILLGACSQIPANSDDDVTTNQEVELDTQNAKELLTSDIEGIDSSQIPEVIQPLGPEVSEAEVGAMPAAIGIYSINNQTEFPLYVYPDMENTSIKIEIMPTYNEEIYFLSNNIGIIVDKSSCGDHCPDPSTFEVPDNGNAARYIVIIEKCDPHPSGCLRLRR